MRMVLASAEVHMADFVKSLGRQRAAKVWMHTPKMRKTFRAAATDA